jgi:hypothetical protein
MHALANGDVTGIFDISVSWTEFLLDHLRIKICTPPWEGLHLHEKVWAPYIPAPHRITCSGSCVRGAKSARYTCTNESTQLLINHGGLHPFWRSEWMLYWYRSFLYLYALNGWVIIPVTVIGAPSKRRSDGRKFTLPPRCLYTCWSKLFFKMSKFFEKKFLACI